MVFKRTSNIAFYFPSFPFRVEIEGSSSAATVQSVSLLLLILKVKPVMMQNHWDLHHSFETVRGHFHYIVSIDIDFSLMSLCYSVVRALRLRCRGHRFESR